MLHKGEAEGFASKNLEGYAGHLEMGQGEELVGILCHVDVVPEGDGWTTPAYSADIRDGKIFARGAIDDKGPTMAAYYAMKIVKELGLPLSKRVRMIIGTDEESNWKCVDHYFKMKKCQQLVLHRMQTFQLLMQKKEFLIYKLCKMVVKRKKVHMNLFHLIQGAV